MDQVTWLLLQNYLLTTGQSSLHVSPPSRNTRGCCPKPLHSQSPGEEEASSSDRRTAGKRSGCDLLSAPRGHICFCSWVMPLARAQGGGLGWGDLSTPSPKLGNATPQEDRCVHSHGSRALALFQVCVNLCFILERIPVRSSMKRKAVSSALSH